MKTDTIVIPAAEVAYILRVKLGPIRAWADFLADNIRERQDVNGERLLPCCRKSDGKTMRPMYAVRDVKLFIAHVLASVPGAGPQKVQPTTLTIDRRRPWRINRFAQDGSPKARAVLRSACLSRTVTSN